jgi:hypothetical protein
VAADQAQPAWVATVSVPVPPAAGVETASGLTKKLHAVACVTEKGVPAIRNIAVRLVIAVFGVTLKLTVPLPVPLAPLTTVTHGAPPVAVHTQPPVVVTATLPVPPAFVNATDGAERA